MFTNSIQLMEIKLTRLGFYLGVYLVPALLSLVQQHWLPAVLTIGMIPGIWRSLRRGNRRGRLDLSEMLLFGLTTALVAVVVAGVSTLLGWVSLLCWTLVAFEQAHRRERRRRFAY
jgi:hypothetical protein